MSRVKFKIRGSLYKAICEFPLPSSTHRLVEYCVSGPILVPFTRNTSYDSGEETKVERTIPESPTPDFWFYTTRAPGMGGAWDLPGHEKINVGDLSLAVRMRQLDRPITY